MGWSGGGALVLVYEPAEKVDPFDRVQLAEVVRICRRSRSASDAGRALFSASRLTKQSSNDDDRCLFVCLVCWVKLPHPLDVQAHRRCCRASPENGHFSARRQSTSSGHDASDEVDPLDTPPTLAPPVEPFELVDLSSVVELTFHLLACRPTHSCTQFGVPDQTV